MQSFFSRFCAVFVGSAVLALAEGAALFDAVAQTSAACSPPAAGEYLLLVINASPDTTAQLERTLPPTTSKTVCDYLGYQVTRVGGFSDSQVASSWAQYLTTNNNLQAFVARSAEGGPAAAVPAATTAQAPTAPMVTAPPPPGLAAPAAPSPSAAPAPAAAPAAAPAPTAIAPAATRGYNPQPLGNGYAVLVDYANRPRVATEVQQLLTRPIGLVSYNQRPYLLAIHTADAATASAVLQQLVERSYSAVMVDSRGAVLLSGSVAPVN